MARDHDELDRLISILVTEERVSKEWRQALDAVRIGFAAHVEAQDRVLERTLRTTPSLARLVGQITAAHHTQEQLLARITDETRPRALLASDALALRSSLLAHDEQERMIVLPGIRDEVLDHHYRTLAGSYATERLRALGSIWQVPRGHVATP